MAPQVAEKGPTKAKVATPAKPAKETPTTAPRGANSRRATARFAAAVLWTLTTALILYGLYAVGVATYILATVSPDADNVGHVFANARALLYGGVASTIGGALVLALHFVARRQSALS